MHEHIRRCDVLDGRLRDVVCGLPLDLNHIVETVIGRG